MGGGYKCIQVKKKIKKVSFPFKPKGLVPKLLNIFYYKKEGKDKNNFVDI